MKENTLPKKTTILWQVRIIFTTLCLVALCLVSSNFFVYFKIAAIVIAILGFLITFWYLPVFFKKYTIVLTNDAVVVKYGIFIKTEHIMPFKRMIYAQSIETPLARKFGIAAVRLKAARSYLNVAETEKSAVEAIINFLAEGERND